MSCELAVRVPGAGEYPPFFTRDKNGDWAGLSIELTEALLNEADCIPKYKPLPFKRGLSYMKQGKIDMMLNLSITPERGEYINFIGPQLDETVVMVVLKEDMTPLSNLDEVVNLPKPVGIEIGKFYGKDFHEKFDMNKVFASKIVTAADINLNENMLLAGRLYAFLGYGYHVYHRFITDPRYEKFAIHPFVVNQDWVYFGFSKKSVPWYQLEKIEAAFESAEKKGVFQIIRKKYTFSNQ